MREIWTRSDLTERARLFLAASVGELSVRDACRRLGLSRQRFYELEDRAVAGYLRELAPKPAGRPAKPTDPTAVLAREIDKLKRENGRLWLYIKVLQRLAGIESVEKKEGARRSPQDLEEKRVIVETAREIQAAGSDLTEYLRVIGVPPSTFGFWAREAAQGKLVPKPPRPPTHEETAFRIDLCHEMKQLAHRRHITFGLHNLWLKYRGRITRDEFRKLAIEIRREVNRERLAGLQRYEFTHPDVAHSMDFVCLPRELSYGPRRYMIRVLDDCTRCTLRSEVTFHKGAGVGGAFLHEHLKAGLLPLVMKYDREFDVAQFENLLLHYKVVPLPSACASPWTNGKNERANGDVQQWIGVWGKNEFWTTDEIRKELAFCFEGIDAIAESAILNGKFRRKEYHARQRAPLDRDAFFKDAVQFHGDLLRRPGTRLTSTDAWRVAAKETLKKYEVVRYPETSELSGDFQG